MLVGSDRSIFEPGGTCKTSAVQVWLSWPSRGTRFEGATAGTPRPCPELAFPGLKGATALKLLSAPASLAGACPLLESSQKTDPNVLFGGGMSGVLLISRKNHTANRAVFQRRFVIVTACLK